MPPGKARGHIVPALSGLQLDMVSSALDGIAADVRLRDAVTGAQVVLTMNGASTLSLIVEDPSLKILNSPAFDTSITSRVDLDLGGAMMSPRRWRCEMSRGAGGLDVAGTSTTIEFWERGAAALKRETAALSKANMTFEQFVAYLAREVRTDATLVPVVTSPRALPPKIASSKSASDREDEATSNGGSGWSPAVTGKVTIKGVNADPDQLKNLDLILQACVETKAPMAAAVAAVAAATQESNVRNLAGLSPDGYGSRGVWQITEQNARRGWKQRDVAWGARKFLTDGFSGRGGAIALAKQGIQPGTIARLVENPGSPDGPYAQWVDEARRTVKLWSGRPLDEWNRTVRAGRGATGASRTREDLRPTAWRRGTSNKPESSWAALQRYCERMGTRRFISAGRLIVASDQALIKATPTIALALDDPEILQRPTIALDGTADIQQLELTVLARHWPAPPGAVVEIQGAGAASGPWLVETLRIDAGSPELAVSLTQPVTEKPREPKATPRTASSPRSQRGGSSAATRGADAAIAWANTKIGVRESGYNRGQTVEHIIRKAGGTPGSAWCGYFCGNALMAGGIDDVSPSIGGVRWIYDSAAAHRHPFTGRGSAASARPGDLAVIYGPGTHVELVVSVNTSRSIVHTIGGNTSIPGGGEGVARKERPFSDVVAIAHVKYPS